MLIISFVYYKLDKKSHTEKKTKERWNKNESFLDEIWLKDVKDLKDLIKRKDDFQLKWVNFYIAIIDTSLV